MRLGLALLSGLVAACGGSSHSSSSSTLDVASFRSTAEAIANAADQHATTMNSVTSVAGCQVELSRYQGAVQPMLDRLRGLSDDMDLCMRSVGQPNYADARATCDVMFSELQTHMTQGCASSDMGVERAEAARHAQAMDGLAKHEEDRADTMGGMMGMSPMMDNGHCSR